MLCSNCQTENPEGAAFCRSCGASLAPAPAVPDPPVAPPAVPDKKAARWPLASGLLMIAGVLFWALTLLLRLILDWHSAFSFYSLFSGFLMIASAVVFLVPSKRSPAVSGLLRLTGAIFILDDFIGSLFGSGEFSFSVSAIPEILADLLLFAVAVFYLILTVIRVKGAALPAIHLVLSLLYLSALLFSTVVAVVSLSASVAYGFPPLLLVIIALWGIGEIFPAVGYIVAAFYLRKKAN